VGEFSHRSVGIEQDRIDEGIIPGAKSWNKFGKRDVSAAASGDQTLWANNTNLVIMTSADTFDIAYTNTTDGAGGSATGATQLLISYLDENFDTQDGYHTLGSTGSDTTSFSGLGINRVVVIASGTADENVSEILITDTTNGDTQAVMPAGSGVTQQCVLHLPIGITGSIKYIKCSASKLSGSNPKVEFKMWSYNRLTDTKYQFWNTVVDTQSETIVIYDDPVGINISGRDVIYLTMDTDRDNTIARGRFSLNTYGNKV
jgi:hypothetical protein